MKCAVDQCKKSISEGIIINSPITQAIDRSTGKVVKINLMEVVCSQCFTKHDLKSKNLGSVTIIT
jgi:hypothetical protein